MRSRNSRCDNEMTDRAGGQTLALFYSISDCSHVSVKEENRLFSPFSPFALSKINFFLSSSFIQHIEKRLNEKMLNAA